MGCHAFAHDRVIAQATPDGAHQVPLGHDPSEPPGLLHEHRTNISISHLLRDGNDGCPSLDRQQIA
jgi:hypothetical protein